MTTTTKPNPWHLRFDAGAWRWEVVDPVGVVQATMADPARLPKVREQIRRLNEEEAGERDTV